MKKVLTFVLISMFLLSGCGAADTDHDHAHEEEPGTGIEVHDPWTRSAFKDENAAVYFLLHNHSDTADELTSVSSDITDETVEIHKSAVDANGVASMTMLTSVPLPADSETTFEPGGLHIMLTGIKKDLNVGDSIDIILHFKTHPDIQVSVAVLDAAMDHSDMDMDMDATSTP